MNEYSNGDLLTAFRDRDAKAFAYIFRLHRKSLVYFAEKILGIREEAEDIVADSFMKLWTRHADFDSLPAIKSFLYVITRNACLDFLKYSKRVSASQKEFSYWADKKEEEILDIMFAAEILSELNGEIEMLPPRCRHIFQLAFFEDLNTNEIAARLRLSEQTVRNQKTKALHIIRTAFLKKSLVIASLVCAIFH